MAQDTPPPQADRALPQQGERALRRREARRTQSYRTFLHELATAGTMTNDEAERAASAVLCALEQRLLGGEAEQLADQLPQRLQEMLWRCERHESSGPPLKLDRHGFLEMVSQDLGLDSSADAEPIVRTVFALLRTQVSEGEAEDVMGQLPEDLRELWRRPV
ncbi:DUF2267 domain-containing protein [Corallococcus llansteffanensis]|uniref:DUF2267 domain-containing protein n=1 Tax=Corallococcus llansteffanensis TaxID=2316731 RepID=A0A3A8QI66_9BACT|nr:DUF2267 domain-containing protein [Corallococcus llansteffanensis]RKH68396.1 DUF2267 domain-containing protein [Corallococcus llansteffanensis]